MQTSSCSKTVCRCWHVEWDSYSLDGIEEKRIQLHGDVVCEVMTMNSSSLEAWKEFQEHLSPFLVAEISVTLWQWKVAHALQNVCAPFAWSVEVHRCVCDPNTNVSCDKKEWDISCLVSKEDFFFFLIENVCEWDLPNKKQIQRRFSWAQISLCSLKVLWFDRGEAVKLYRWDTLTRRGNGFSTWAI